MAYVGDSLSVSGFNFCKGPVKAKVVRLQPTAKQQERLSGVACTVGFTLGLHKAAKAAGRCELGNSNGPKGEGSNPAMSAAMMGNSNGPKGKGSNPAQSAAMMGNSSAKGRGGGPGSRGGNSKRTERCKRDAALAAVAANNKKIDAFFTKKAKIG